MKTVLQLMKLEYDFLYYFVPSACLQFELLYIPPVNNFSAIGNVAFILLFFFSLPFTPSVWANHCHPFPIGNQTMLDWKISTDKIESAMLIRSEPIRLLFLEVLFKNGSKKLCLNSFKMSLHTDIEH